MSLRSSSPVHLLTNLSSPKICIRTTTWPLLSPCETGGPCEAVEAAPSTFGITHAGGNGSLGLSLPPKAVGLSRSLSLFWLEGWHQRLRALPSSPLQSARSPGFPRNGPAVCIWNQGAGVFLLEGTHFIFQMRVSWKVMGNSMVFAGGT